MWKTLALAFALAGLAAVPAHAHARLIRAQPRVGSTLAASPTDLRLQFSETLLPGQAHVTLKAADGHTVALGPISLDLANPRIAVAPVPVALAPGAYRVDWDVTSTDTHETYGDFTFRVGR